MWYAVIIEILLWIYNAYALTEVFFIQARSKANVVFDLSRYRDFSLQFINPKGKLDFIPI